MPTTCRNCGEPLPTACGKCGTSLPISLARAHKLFYDIIIDGKSVKCPCCERPDQIHRRRLLASMARGLLWLIWKWERTKDWVHVPDTAPRHIYRTQDIAKTKHWGLSEGKPNTSDPTRKELGLWRPLPKGIEFAAGRLLIPKFVLVYRDELMGSEGPDVSVEEVLEEPFDYSVLMADNNPSMFWS